MEIIGHDISPKDFVPGKIHQISKRKVLFSVQMTPAVVMHNPKYPHNVGAAVRAASCFGARTIIFSGDRLGVLNNPKARLPREERMKGYYDVTMLNDDYPFNRFPKEVTPVAVEVRKNSEMLPDFIHPEFPVYVFGPEDGSLPQITLSHCHRFLRIPSKHCLSLGNAVNIVLYDRMVKAS
jgi:tRNA(Leu) C34 or U34 (ribose-2'-O)-methylase TrmL